MSNFELVDDNRFMSLFKNLLETKNNPIADQIIRNCYKRLLQREPTRERTTYLLEKNPVYRDLIWSVCLIHLYKFEFESEVRWVLLLWLNRYFLGFRKIIFAWRISNHIKVTVWIRLVFMCFEDVSDRFWHPSTLKFASETCICSIFSYLFGFL